MSAALVIFSLLWPFVFDTDALPGGWGGNYAPCDRHRELLKAGRMALTVRFSISDPQLTTSFTRALNFWSTVLDMEWRREDSRECSVHVFTGNAGLFRAAESARAQFPDRLSFQGWIAFNPKVSLSEDEQYLVSVHELGHIFGLLHNSSSRSIMFFLGVDGPAWLDAADMAALGARHKLRLNVVKAPVLVPTIKSAIPTEHLATAH